MKYSPISTEDDQVTLDKNTPTGIRPRQRSLWSRLCQALPWVLTAIFTSTSVLLSVALDQSRDGQGRDHMHLDEVGTFSEGFATDFRKLKDRVHTVIMLVAYIQSTDDKMFPYVSVTARQHIKVEQTRFTGSPSFHENGTMWIPHPEPKLYVGDPEIHPEIDKNWDDLTWGMLLGLVISLAIWSIFNTVLKQDVIFSSPKRKP